MRRVNVQDDDRILARQSAAAAHSRARRGTPQSRRRSYLLRWSLIGCVVFSLSAGLSMAWRTGWLAAETQQLVEFVHGQSAELGLAVSDVLVEGRLRSERTTVLDALDVERGSAILAFQPETARKRLEALPWVRSARVERRLPDKIFVRLVERQPMAIWQRGGEFAVIDTEGQEIAGAAPGEFTELPLVVGKGANTGARQLLAMLASEPDLAERVRAAVRVSERRWNLRLDAGIDVQLPEDDPAKAWAQLARIQRTQGVLERDIVTIDLRLPDRLVVRMAPGVAPIEPESDSEPPGENT
jgi:cell division protein FtsQ